MDIKNKFGNKVREIRKRKGLSQEQLSAKAKLHRTYISDIERGIKNVSLENIERLAVALEIDLSYLFIY